MISFVGSDEVASKMIELPWHVYDKTASVSTETLTETFGTPGREEREEVCDRFKVNLPDNSLKCSLSLD